MKVETKSMLSSRTFWLAILQMIAGFLVVIFNQFPELQAVGSLAIAKSLLDIIIRVTSTETQIK